MRITLYRAVADVDTADQQDTSWDALCSRLSDFRVSPNKDGPGWSPCAFTGSVRNDAGVSEIFALTLDVDKDAAGQRLTRQAVGEALGRLRKQGLRMLVHTTHSHTPEAPSLRVVVALSRPVAAPDWRRFYRAAATELGIPFEPKCLNPSRFWYLPSAADVSTATVKIQQGHPLDVDAVLARAPAPAPAASSAPPGEHSYPAATKDVIDAARAVLERHGPAVQGKGGDTHTLVAAMKLRHDFALSEDESVALLSVWNLTCVPPWSAAELRAKVRGSYGHAAEPYGAARERVAGGLFAPVEPAQPVAPPSTELGQARRLSTLLSGPRPKITTYPTDFLELNALIGGGWLTRTLHVVIGPPGAGKTAFAVSAAHALRALGIAVLYVSTELESIEVAYRHAALELKRAWTSLERGEFPAAEVEAALEKLDVYALGADVILDPSRAVEAIDAEVQRITALHGRAPVVIVDYLQDLVRGAGDERAVRSLIGQTATQLRQLSQVRDCAVLAVSSVSRLWYGQAKADTLRSGDDASAYLSAAKESGEVDYAAATVIFLDVGRDDGTAAERPSRLCVAKARRGRCGFAGARFAGATGAWREDAGALEVMSTQGQKKVKDETSDAEYERRVLQKMRELNYPATATEIREGCGTKGKPEEAIERLFARKEIRAAGKSGKGTLWALAEPKEPEGG